MQLKDIGKLSSEINEVKAAGKGLGSIVGGGADEIKIERILSAINGIDDIKDVNTVFKNAKLDKDSAIKVLEQSKFSDSLEDISKNATEAGASITNMQIATNELSSAGTTGMTGFKNAFKGVFTQIKSMLPMLAIVGGAFAAYKGWKFLDDKFTLTYGTATKHLDESVGNYTKAKEDLNSINSELKTTSARIDELKGKDKLTLTEQAELDKLERQNKLLEQQSKIKQNVVNAKQKTAANDALKKLDFESEKGFETDRNGNYVAGPDGSPMMDSLTRTEKVKKDINSLKEEESLLNSINKQLSTGKNKSGKKLSKEDKKTLETDFKNTQNNIDEYKESISKMMDDINSDAANLYNKDTGLVLPDSKYQKKAKEIEKLNDTYLETIEGKSAKAAKAMDDIWEKNPKFAEAQQKMVDAFRSGKDLSVKDITKEFPDLVSACDKAGISVETLRDELKALSEQDNGVTKLEGDFTKFQNTAVSAINSMDVLNAAMANSFTGKGLSVELDKDTGELAGDITHVIDAYKGLDGYDPSVLFEKTANGIHLNREALRQLQAQKESYMKKDFKNQKDSLQDRLNKALAEQKNYENGSKDYKNSEVVINDLKNQLETVQLLASAYDGATSAYQKWVDAQSNGEEGDMFRTVSDTMKKRGDQLYQEGRYNTNEFRAIADYFSYDDLSTAPVEKLVEAYQNATNARDAYFTGNKQGIDNFMADLQRVSEAEGKDWTKINKDGFMEFDTNTDEEIAKRFNLSKEAVQALFRAASEYSEDYKIKLGDTSKTDIKSEPIKINVDYSDLDKLKETAQDSLNTVQEMVSKNSTLKLNLDSTNVKDIDDQISHVQDALSHLRDENGNINLTTEGGEAAMNVLNALYTQKLKLSGGIVMSVDTSQLDGGLKNAMSTLQEFQQAYTQLQEGNTLKAGGVDVDTTEAQQKVQSLASEIQNFDANTKASLGLDTSDFDAALSTVKNQKVDVKADVNLDQASLGTIQSAISAISPEMLVKAGVDASAINGYEPPQKKSKVEYGVDDSKVQAYDPPGKKATVTYTADTSGLPITLDPISRTVNYVKGKGSEASGTLKYPARSSGTAYNMLNLRSAYAGGKVSLPHDEVALVNEMGVEGLIRGGVLTPIPGGMHMQALKKGDIILSASQMESLYLTGKASGHGKAYANGTVGSVRNFAQALDSPLSAYSSGTWVFGNTGNGNIGGSGSTPSSWSPPINTTPIQNAAETVQSEAESTSDALKELTDNIDHVATKLNRLEHATERAEKSIDRAIGIVNKEKENSKALEAIKDEIAGNKKAYDVYINKAQEFASQSGLSEDLQSKIQTGAYEITHYNDDTKSKINQYKEYYEAALDAQDKILELQDKEIELAQERLSYIKEFNDAVISLKDSLIDLNDTKIELSNAVGNSAVSNDVKKILSDSISKQEASYEQAVQQLTDYQNEFNNLVENGYLKEGSNDWYEAQKQITEFAKQVAESNIALIELQDKIRDIDYQKIQNAIDATGRAIDRLQHGLDLKESRNEQITRSDYQKQIDLQSQSIQNNYAQRNKKLSEQNLYAVGSERYNEIAEEIAKLDDEIYSSLTEIENLRNKVFESEFFNFDKDIKNMQDFRGEIDTFRGFLNKDAFFEKDSGAMTSEAYANIALIAKGMSTAKKEVANYTEGIKKLDQMLKSGLITQTEYDDKQKEMLGGIRDSVGAVHEYRNELLDLYKTQVQKENDALKENISLRKDALSKQKEYWDYADKVKTQSKDVDALNAQIAALEGVTNASAVATRKKLIAQRDDAQKELDNTKRDHKYDMMQDGYDKMTDNLDKSLEDTLYQVASNADMQEQVINEMLNRVVANYKDAYGKINSIISSTGIIGSTDFNSTVSNLGTQNGASNIISSATQNQSTVKPNNSVTGINPNNTSNSNHSSIESDISKDPNTTNRLVAEITFNTNSVTIEEGKQASVVAKIRPTDAKNKTLKWVSSNLSIATVSNGTIKGVKPGTCQVSASATDGSGITSRDKVSVTITKKPEPPKPKPTPKPQNKPSGDGVARVGDKVTLKPNQSYYYDSWGVSPAGNLYSGVENGVVIDGYSGSEYGGQSTFHGDFGVHIKSADGKYGDLGWVRLDQLEGYASGTKFVDKDQLAWTQENGNEIIIKPNGSMLTPLPRGSAVLNNGLTENIWKMAENADSILNATNLGLNFDDIPSSLNSVNRDNSKVENNFDSIINVEGNLSKDVIPDLEKMIDRMIPHISDKLGIFLKKEKRKL